MKSTYVADTKRLNVFGSNSEKDILAIKKLIADKKVPADLKSIVYQKAKDSKVVMIIRGRYLENLLRVETDVVVPLPVRPGIKAILKQINEANTRQATYAGLLLYSTSTKRFLFTTTRNRENTIMLFGDHPLEGESPPETVCRVAQEDGNFEIQPDWLIALAPLEINGTTYYSYLCMTRHEFKLTHSERILSSIWKPADAIGELKLDISVSALFDKDKKLMRLIQTTDVDYEKIIDEILHSS
jgi:hypothetical protein